MKNCTICNNPIPHGMHLKVTCGDEDCRRKHHQKIANAARSRKRAEMGPAFWEKMKPRYSPARVFSLESCPFESGAAEFGGRQPDFNLGF